MVLDTFNELTDYIGQHHTIIKDVNEVLSFYYEYACLMCEYQGIDPRKATNYIHTLMIHRLRTTAFAVRQNYFARPQSYVILDKLLAKANPEEAVRHETKMSIRLIENKKYKTLDDWLKDHQ